MTDKNKPAQPIDWLVVTRELEQTALKGPWPGVSTPHYALSGLFKALGDEIAALRQPAPAGEVEKHLRNIIQRYDECSGAEPSLSVLFIAIDDARAAIQTKGE